MKNKGLTLAREALEALEGLYELLCVGKDGPTLDYDTHRSKIDGYEDILIEFRRHLCDLKDNNSASPLLHHMHGLLPMFNNILELIEAGEYRALMVDIQKGIPELTYASNTTFMWWNHPRYEVSREEESQ